MTSPTTPEGEAGEIADDRLARAIALLGEHDSSDAFAAAVRLVEAAAAAGDGPALCLLATIEAIGAGRPRNWARAIDLLARAARSGSDHARAQLLLLKGADAREGDWQGLRAGIRIDELLAAPRATPLSERPRLRVFHGFARPEECAWIMTRLERKLKPAMVWDDASGVGRTDPNRSNRAAELRLLDMDVVLAVVRARIAAATRLPEFIFEVPQLMHYRVGEEFRPHHDFLDPEQSGHHEDLARRGQRMGTFLLYLNDDFEGGETVFPRAGIAHRGRAGDALFFANVTPDGRPDPLTLHAGRPPSRNEKWILSQWIRDRAPGA